MHFIKNWHGSGLIHIIHIICELICISSVDGDKLIALNHIYKLPWVKTYHQQSKPHKYYEVKANALYNSPLFLLFTKYGTAEPEYHLTENKMNYHVCITSRRERLYASAVKRTVLLCQLVLITHSFIITWDNFALIINNSHLFSENCLWKHLILICAQYQLSHGLYRL